MEKKEEKDISFGRFLSMARAQKGLGLDTISKQIKVNGMILQHIENENHAKLPDEVFVKGFIRAYADSLGIDKADIIRRYEKSRAHYQNALKAEADLVGYTSKFWFRFFVAGMVLFVVICFSIFIMPVKNGRQDHKKEKEQVAENLPAKINDKSPPEEIGMDSVNAFDVPSPADHPVQPAEGLPENQVFDKLYLKIRAVDQTWIKIIVDKQKPRELTLKAGDIKEIKGEKHFNLLIGNAAGVNIFLNEKPVEIPGKKGQVVTVMLP